MPDTANKINPFDCCLEMFKCCTYQELYLKLKSYARLHFEMECLRFPLSDLEEPDRNTRGVPLKIIKGKSSKCDL